MYVPLLCNTYVWLTQLSSIIEGTSRFEPLSITKSNFCSLLHTLQVPPRFLQTLFANNGQFSHSITYNDSDQPTHLCPSPRPARITPRFS